MNEATNSISKYTIGALFTAELYGVVFDLRWFIGLLSILMVADFWFGCRESLAKHIEIRKSRCLRRTLNKFGDYFMYLIIGFVLGGAIFEPLGWCNPTAGAIGGLIVACIAECDSIFDHWLKLHNLKWSWRTFLLAIVKCRYKDLGNALEKASEVEPIKSEENGKS